MKRVKDQQGFTLLELVVSLAISALILPLVGGIVFMLQFYPGRTQADIQAQQDQQLVGQWITIDANRADHFNTSSGPNEYGGFSWTEYGGDSPVSVEVTYLYDDATTSLVRRVTRDGVADWTSVVARNIAAFGDVVFTSTEPTFALNPSTGLFEFTRGRVTVRPTATVERVGQDPAVLTSTVVAELRSQFTGAMAAPEATPTPTPPPAPSAWTILEDTPAPVKSGGAITNDGTDLYAFRGDRKTTFWKFDVGAGSWALLASTPQNVKDGGALTYTTINNAGFIYGLRGDNKRNFWRYDISIGTWEDRANAPSNVDLGGALAWDGEDTIYTFGGNETRNFWGYSISTDAWSSLTKAPENVDRGGSLVYASDAVYALRGDDLAGQRDFWKYTVETGTWSSLADTPAPIGKGGALAWDEVDHIYALRGNNTTNFWRYSISANSWDSFPDTPQTVSEGGALTYLNNDVYALRGGKTTAFWKFITGGAPPPPPSSPTALIISPAGGSTFLPSVSIPFSGTGTDADGGALTGASLVWTSSLDGQIGTGVSFSATLGAGSHTITLTATDGQGLSGSASVGITVNTPPTASITSPPDGSTFLTTESIAFIGSGTDAEDGLLTGASLVWKSSLIGQIGTGSSFSASLNAGSHTITLTATDGLGAETESAPVNITVGAPPQPNSPPTASIISPPGGSVFLTTDSIAFSGSATDPEDGPLTGASLVWTSNLDGQIDTGESFSASLSAGSHTITLTATDSQLATGSASISITVNAPPTASITSPITGDTFVSTDSVAFSGSATDPEDGPLTGASLVWMSSLDSQIGTGESFSASLSAGSHTITLTATDSDGASGSASVSVTVDTPPNVPPTASITNPTTGGSFLTTDSIPFSGSATDAEDGTLTGASLVWTSSLDSQIGTGESFSASLSAGSHTITLTATDSQLATGSASISITVDAPPLPNSPPTASIISPPGGSIFLTTDSIAFSGSATDPEDGPLTGAFLVWTSSLDSQIGTGESFSASLSAGSHTITLTATDSDGASGSASIGITVNSPPTASITSPTIGDTFLTTDNVLFTGSATDPEDGPLTGASLVWTSSLDNQIGTGESFSASLSAGSHTITLTATDSDGASGSASIGITVNAPPTASITNPTTGDNFLTTDSIAFTGSATDPEDGPLSGASLVWTSSLGSQIGTGTSFSASLSPGSHTITLTATDSDGASGSASIGITVNAPPTPSITSPTTGDTFLTTDSILFTGSATDPEDGPLTGVSLVWTSSLDSQIGTGTSFSASLSPGSHAITLTATDSDGASGSASVNVTVDTPPNAPPAATIASPTNGDSFLTTDSILFIGSGTDTEDGALTGASLVWTSSLDNQIGTGTSFSASLSAGSHTITLTVTDSQLATGIASISITVDTPPNVPPTASITSPTTGDTFLTTDSILFTGSATDPEDGALTGASLVWTSNLDGQIDTGTSFSASLSAGSHTITLTATDSLLATGSASISITVEIPPNSPPTATVTSPTNGDTFLTTDSIPFSGAGTDPEDGALTGASLVWTSSLDGPIDTGTSFSASLSAGSHTITLTATDSQLATGSASVSITVNPPPPPSAWETLSATPTGVNQGGAITTDGTHLYALRGDSEKDFWKFDPGSGTWAPLESTPQNVKDGGALTYGGGFIYAFRGGKKTDFWRFDVNAGTWSILASAPEKVKDGGALVYLNGFVYALRGDRKRDFWRYNVAATTWEFLENAPTTVQRGGSLTTNGTSIYALRGGGKRDFWQYSVTEDAWTTLLEDTPGSISRGGSLASDGTSIYALRGSASTDFWKFDIGSGTWIVLPSTPLAVDGGGSLVFLNGEFYALRGGGTTNFWKQ